VVPRVEIAVTWAPSSTPLSASSVTVAGWWTLILLTSDSLKATVIVSVWVLTISTNPVDDDEPLELLLEPPRLPALLLPRLEELDDPLEPELLEALDPPADTSLPGEIASTETTVPVLGAYRWVSCSAVSAF
jgi:hypothetical protein